MSLGGPRSGTLQVPLPPLWAWAELPEDSFCDSCALSGGGALVTDFAEAVARALPVNVRVRWRNVQAPGIPSLLPGPCRAYTWPASFPGPPLMPRPPDPSPGRQLGEFNPPCLPLCSRAPRTRRGLLFSRLLHDSAGAGGGQRHPELPGLFQQISILQDRLLHPYHGCLESGKEPPKYLLKNPKTPLLETCGSLPHIF